MNATVLLKLLAIPVIAIGFFLMFSSYVIASLGPYFSFTDTAPVRTILLVTALRSVIFSVAAAVILALPAAVIYKRFAPIAALLFMSPFLYFGVTAFDSQTPALLFATGFPIFCDVLFVTFTARRTALRLEKLRGRLKAFMTRIRVKMASRSSPEFVGPPAPPHDDTAGSPA